jgi:hypothetical protein
MKKTMQYNIIINTGIESEGNQGFITYRKVNSIDKFILFANSKYPYWKFATVYDKATRNKVKVIKP